jgi:hypothetical protein
MFKSTPKAPSARASAMGDRIMISRAIIAALVGVALMFTSLSATAESPFGNAKRVTLTSTETKNITAAGYWADYYGSLGMDYLDDAAYYAYYWGYLYDSWYYEYYGYKKAMKFANLAKKYFKLARDYAGQ